MLSVFASNPAEGSTNYLQECLTPYLTNAEIEWGEHGPQGLSLTLDMPQRLAWRLYGWSGRALHLPVYWRSQKIWSGRADKVTLTETGCKITGAGHWQALTDLYYTALWSTTAVNAWQQTLTAQRATANPNMYAFDTNNRLQIGLTKNSVYRNLNDYGGLYYLAPDRGERAPVTISFDYSILLPNNFLVQINRFNSSYGGGVNVWGLATTGVLQTGTQNLTFTASDLIEFAVYNNTGANYTMAGESGTFYARITNVRIKTTTASTVQASAILNALTTFVNATNPFELQSLTSRVNVTTLDLFNELYEDRTPAEIIEELELLHGYVAQVDPDKILSWGPKSIFGQQWAVNISTPEVERTLSDVYNRRYATYQEAGGRTLRSTDANNLASQQLYGIVRELPVNANTTSASTATTIRDTVLADSAAPTPRYAITVEDLYTIAGARAAVVDPRPGDRVTIRNLPAVLGSTGETLRTFRVSRVAASFQRGSRPRVTLEAEQPAPRLDSLLARLDKGVKR